VAVPKAGIVRSTFNSSMVKVCSLSKLVTVTRTKSPWLTVIELVVKKKDCAVRLNSWKGCGDGVGVGGIRVAVGGTGVSVRVGVGGIRVAVGGTGVSVGVGVGGRAVAEDGRDVTVAGTGVSEEVGVGVALGGCVKSGVSVGGDVGEKVGTGVSEGSGEAGPWVCESS